MKAWKSRDGFAAEKCRSNGIKAGPDGRSGTPARTKEIEGDTVLVFSTTAVKKSGNISADLVQK